MNSPDSSGIPLLDLPEDIELAVGLTRTEFRYHVRLMAALKMFELGKISSGKAAELAGMSRVDFFEACGLYQVSIINISPEDLDQELRRDAAVIRVPEANAP